MPKPPEFGDTTLLVELKFNLYPEPNRQSRSHICCKPESGAAIERTVLHMITQVRTPPVQPFQLYKCPEQREAYILSSSPHFYGSVLQTCSQKGLHMRAFLGCSLVRRKCPSMGLTSESFNIYVFSF